MSRRVALASAAAWGFAVWLGSEPPARAEPESDDAAAIAAQMQLFYDAAQSYVAEFTQTTKLVVAGTSRTRRGRVSFEKPGKLSFRYAPPSEDRVVSDGKSVKAYDAEARVLYLSKLALSPYPIALAFLDGTGILRRDFGLRALSSDAALARGGAVLEAVPNEATPAYSRILFFADRASGEVRRVLVLDAQGNRNRFEFTAPRVNQPIPAREFRLPPPPGSSVVEL